MKIVKSQVLLEEGRNGIEGTNGGIHLKKVWMLHFLDD